MHVSTTEGGAPCPGAIRPRQAELRVMLASWRQALYDASISACIACEKGGPLMTGTSEPSPRARGGLVRAERLSADDRSAIAREGANKRWAAKREADQQR